ncbi:MAG: hypothetical protein IJR65_07830 [Oscillospiraceae bacterium]|nr:hypothetical protein [Oscillospiraceae bacterium]
MPSIINYKCPACTGPLHYVGSSGKLECDYCGSVYDVAEIEALQKPKEEAAQAAFQQQQQQEAKEAAEAAAFAADGWDASAISANWGADAQGMRAYNCPSCGAELICDETTAATSCPYCGNNTIVPGQFSGTLKPDLILPFRLDKQAALDALRNHYRKKPFLPKRFSDQNQIEQIRGIYVPFWLFDGTAEADATFEGTRSHTRRQGKYEVTTTEHYNVHRSGSLAFEKVPVDASSKIPADHMDSIEPFNYDELMPFSTAYMPGFLADKYDISAADCISRADDRCENTVIDALRDTVHGYETVTPMGHEVWLHRGKVHYALLPVWLLNTKYNGKDYLFAMNGQTGRLVGDLPVDKGKFWLTFAAIAVPIAAAISAALMFL